MMGGKTWNIIADESEPNYKSCIQFIPNTGGKGIIATGFTGTCFSNDQGTTWTKISEDSFYTLRFLNDSIAYAGGKNILAKLTFKN